MSQGRHDQTQRNSRLSTGIKIPACAVVSSLIVFSLLITNLEVGCSSTTIAPSQTREVNTAVNTEEATGQYEDYYLGLVKSPTALGGRGCYDDKGQFIVLINNRNATNPSYSELVNFLQSDKTDEFPYQLSLVANRFYYGQAEDNINLAHIKEIIDGTAQPTEPGVCADFAERLHNEAEMSGIKCGYVVIDNLNHALNVFDTTDKGLVFVDDTGEDYRFAAPIPPSFNNSTTIVFGETDTQDKLAYLEKGEPYGLIDIDSASYFGTDYAGYRKWCTTKSEFDTLYRRYDDIYYGVIAVPNADGQLRQIIAQEKSLANKLGGFRGTLGVVDSYYITWDGNWRNQR